MKLGARNMNTNIDEQIFQLTVYCNMYELKEIKRFIESELEEVTLIYDALETDSRPSDTLIIKPLLQRWEEVLKSEK